MRKLTNPVDLDAGDVAAVPERLYGPYLPVTADDVDSFNGLFGDEIDSDFASSIRCCDRCYDDFQARWPGTALRNPDFQQGSLELDYAIEQSRVFYFYSPGEISTLRHFVRCERCHNYVHSAIWIHEHAAADEFEDDIERIGVIAQRTPFLLLEDDFARSVLADVKRLGSSATAAQLPPALFRARRKAEFGNSDPALLVLGAFGPPPAEHVTEGRFNHAGLPMLYLADSVETALVEIGSVGEEICIASLEIRGDFKVLDLIVEEPDEAEWALLGAIAESALVAAPRTGPGWIRKEYVFTRFVADCAIDAGFDFVRFGSTKCTTGANYVMLSPPADLAAVASLTGLSVQPLPA